MLFSILLTVLWNNRNKIILSFKYDGPLKKMVCILVSWKKKQINIKFCK